MKYSFILLLCISIFIGCRDRLKVDSKSSLEYSVDTILFDTIFTDLGTRTIRFKIYNHSDGKIIVDNIHMPAGEKSEYYINANGSMLGLANSLDILPNDSIFLFVQAKLKERGADTAVFHKEYLTVEYNNRKDEIPILSYGQDVNKLYGASLETQTWSGGKPYLIFDSLHIKKGHTLTIEAGTNIYCRTGVRIIAEGGLVCNGEYENPVVFRPVFTDTSYYSVPNQWGSIVLRDESFPYHFSYTNILRGTNGIFFQFEEYAAQSMVHVENCYISTMGKAGVVVENANSTIINTIISGCDSYGLYLGAGGTHRLIHNTFTEGNPFSGGSTAVLNIAASTDEGTLEIYIGNSIITDNSINSNAIQFPADSVAGWKAEFINCVVSAEGTISDNSHFIDCYQMQDTSRLFEYDSDPAYILDSASVAINIGSSEIAKEAMLDRRQTDRNADGKPDAGAYEYFKYEEE